MGNDHKKDKFLVKPSSVSNEVANIGASNHEFIQNIKDNSSDYAYIKTERISDAVYLITNGVSDQEPLKWKLRSICLEVLDSMGLLARGGMTLRNSQEIKEKLRTLIAELKSMLNISVCGNLVSSMNSSILLAELDNVANVISKQSLPPFDEELKSGFFIVPESTSIHSENEKVVNLALKDKIQEQSRSKEISSKGVPFKEFRPISIRKNQRKGNIINLVRRKKDVTIKDINEVITGCSEKTIQRLLNSLISEGILKKSGKRRWTKYMLA